jgi:predicted RNA-binding Zn-ribbon protein involved in translation (DUF1610 family)
MAIELKVHKTKNDYGIYDCPKCGKEAEIEEDFI